MFDALDTIKAGAKETGGGFTAVELLDFEGSAVPLHVSGRWDRAFYILDGQYAFVIGEGSVQVSAGAWVFVPRDTVHGWRCDSPQGRVLSITTPGGLEAFYREVGEPVTDRSRLPAKIDPDVAALSRAAALHGIRIVGPPPGA